MSYFIGKSYLKLKKVEHKFFNSLATEKKIKIIAKKKYILSWQSKGLSDKSIKPPSISDNSLTPLIDYFGNKIRVKFTGSCLKQPNISCTLETIVKIYIAYDLDASSSQNNDPTIKNCRFGAATLSKNSDIDKYGFSGYGIGFDRRSNFSFSGGGLVKMH